MNIEKLEKFLITNNQPNFRLKQIKKALFQDGVSSFAEIFTLSKDLREELEREIMILSFSVEKVLVTKDEKSAKALLKLSDGNLIESVLISPMENTWSVCVSSQVGCPLGCEFCSTGKMGLIRNLTAEEITDQVLFWKQYLKKIQDTRNKKQINFKSQSQNSKNENCPPRVDERLSPRVEAGKLKIENYDVNNVVYMGMGEPFLIWEEVSRSLRDLIDPTLFGMSARSLSVSTAGIPEGISKMAREFPQVNLALSLHFGSDEKRSQVMPINRKNNLEVIRVALKKYFELSNRKVFLEYVMLDGVNDSQRDADDLVRFVKSIGKLQLLHINLIRYNTTDSKFKSSSQKHTLQFRDYLVKNNLSVTIRKSLGEEIQGACGQLAGKK